MHNMTALKPLRWVDDEDEAIAVRYPVTVLISASCHETVEAVARRVHAVTFGAAASFVRVPAGAFFSDHPTLDQRWHRVVKAADGGSLFITDVEEMPDGAQAVVVHLLTELQGAQRQAPTVRVMAGSTVSLLERVAAGRFSERLFYRLNIIHLVV